jgi:hypothetical protein
MSGKLEAKLKNEAVVYSNMWKETSLGTLPRQRACLDPAKSREVWVTGWSANIERRDHQ